MIKRVFTALITLLVVGLIFSAAWRERTFIFNKFLLSALSSELAQPLVPNNETRQQLDRTLDLEYVNGIQVIAVDFARNIRYSVYRSTNNRIIEASWTAYMSTRTAIPLLFTSNEANNLRLISIINGKFTCEAYTENIGARIYPGSKTEIAEVCSQAIPPGFGEVIGYINFYSPVPLTEEQRTELKNRAIEISQSIFQENARRFQLS